MEIFEHGGNLNKINRELDFPKNDWIDFSANINPLGLTDELKYCILQRLEEITHYPDPKSVDFLESISKRFSVKFENIIAGNGASELFFSFVRVIEKKKVVIVTPSYSDYERAALLEQKEIEYFNLKENENFILNCDLLEKALTGNEMVILGRPNNPSGNFTAKKDILNLIKKKSESVFIIDEAFIDFINFKEDETNESLCDTILPNLIVISSLTKMYSIAGLRVGFAIGHQDLVNQAKKLQSSWPLNTFAQNTGEMIMKNSIFFQNHVKATRKYIDEQRKFLFEKLKKINQIKVYPSRVNFILFKIIDQKNHREKLYDYLLKYGIIIRTCNNFHGLDASFYRMAILTAIENQKFIEALEGYFNLKDNVSAIYFNKNKKTPALMIAGTGSNVGKSLLTTALCRIFLNEGLRVFPFKAQNMSLNSCVTLDGMELSRAQYLQAQAARVEPDIKMNPVLLKPVGKLTSQVILMGKPIGNQGYMEYRENKESIWKTVCQAYDNLSANADLMILEGAGSPVEMNLKNHDIVNMRMAGYAEAKVLLAGNIDFGGIYASLAGTLMLLNERERQSIIGLIVNQFRGDENLFKEGRVLLEKITGKPVVGVIPFVEKLLLPDEDSMAFSARQRSGRILNQKNNMKMSDKILDIYVIRLPHMSNFTDFDPFFQQEEINLIFLDSIAADHLQSHDEAPDALIIPGSKNVISDMNWLNESGLANYIHHLRENTNAEIIGLCGGFQILGKAIKDPHSIESTRGEINGLGLLSMTTELAYDKTLKRFSGKHLASNISVYGYEIHHGITEGSEKTILQSNDIAGLSSSDDRVWGTYIHGVFDNDEFRKWFFNKLLSKKNRKPFGNVVPYDVDSAIENFADIVKSSLDMDKIRKAVFS
ncbi:MAG: cobyric acid synthase [Spirochaetia bacterium]|nr:cobyric acid synthase [Spirochaetia bacterium]